MPAEDDGDVPPLEDCSELIAHANKLRKKGAAASRGSQPPKPSEEEKKVVTLEVSSQQERKTSPISDSQPKVRRQKRSEESHF